MIDSTIVQRLKQTNISRNGEKTAQRVQQLWKAATKEQKNAIEESAGISRATIYRVYNTGSVSAKLVTPMAFNFNVNPKYLTGETDDKGECDLETVVEFLTKLGYGNLLTPELLNANRADLSSDDDEDLDYDDAELTLDDINLLVQSILLRERAGVNDAQSKASKLRALLLS